MDTGICLLCGCIYDPAAGVDVPDRGVGVEEFEKLKR
jgi:rubredoxin